MQLPCNSSNVLGQGVAHGLHSATGGAHMVTPLEAALAARDDLDKYGTAKRSLFALQLTLGLDDIHTVASSAVTDGPDDKSCDVIYVDRDLQTIVLIQGYESGNPEARQQAPGNKAAAVHQALAWILSDLDEDQVPERLRSARNEVHQALADGVITNFEIWFVHNVPESGQIQSELATAALLGKHLISTRYDSADVEVSASEVGIKALEDRYTGSQTPILVTDTVVIDVTGAFTESGDNWEALCTSLPADWLHKQFETHRERLFSANVRGYLGSKRSQTNINNGIQETVRNEPHQFWAYNNGITALVNGFAFDPDAGTVTLDGLAIVNGAQTTGSIGSLEDGNVAESRVMARFIKCDDQRTVQEIIRYNNRQNPTQASDFRSNDRVQSRLVKEFEELGVVGYNGGRRGGAEDVIRRPGANQILATVAAQALAAFHGRPDVAYHQKGQIWEDDAVYSSVFPERVSAQHIMFTCALLKAVEDAKLQLAGRPNPDQDDRDLMAWFSLRGSNMLAVTAFGAVTEIVLDRTVADRYAVRFKRNLTLQGAANAFGPTLQAALALAPSQLTEPLSARGLRNRSKVEESLASFRALFNATKGANRPVYEKLADQLIIG